MLRWNWSRGKELCTLEGKIGQLSLCPAIICESHLYFLRCLTKSSVLEYRLIRILDHYSKLFTPVRITWEKTLLPRTLEKYWSSSETFLVKKSVGESKICQQWHYGNVLLIPYCLEECQLVCLWTLKCQKLLRLLPPLSTPQFFTPTKRHKQVIKCTRTKRKKINIKLLPLRI